MTHTLDLFDAVSDPQRNLLPADGEVYNHGRIYRDDEAQSLFGALRESVPWQHDELVIAGKRLVTARQVAWYGDGEKAYHYSGSTKVALPWMQGRQRAGSCSRSSSSSSMYANEASPGGAQRASPRLAMRRPR